MRVRGKRWIVGAIGAVLLASSGAQPTTENHPAPGSLLVASRDLIDPNFTRTVVLLLGYGDDGAMGLVVNRRGRTRLFDAFPDMERLQDDPNRLYEGGPVSPDLLTAVFRADDTPEGSIKLVGDLHVSADGPLVESIIAANEGEDRFRIYAGYAGWSPGQLDHEIARGGWHIVPGDPEVVFNDDGDATWRRVLPRDPSMSAELATVDLPSEAG